MLKISITNTYEVLLIFKIVLLKIFSKKFLTLPKFQKQISQKFHQKLKFNEITIFQPPDVYVLLHFQHFPQKLQIDQILYIKRTYILCNNIRKKRKDTKSLYIKKFNSITRV